METLPVLSALVHIPVVRSLLAGVLPGLALRLLLLALPALLGRLVRWAGAASEAEVDFRATTLCFNFQVMARCRGRTAADSGEYWYYACLAWILELLLEVLV